MTSPTPQLGRAGERCDACTAPLAEDQRYCLNCGERRGQTRVAREHLLHVAASEADPAVLLPAGQAPAGPRTVSPMGAAAGLGLLLFAVLTGATLGDRGEQLAAPAPTTAVVAMTAATTPAASTPTTFVSDWTGAGGWTVQLQVLDREGNTPEQIAAAKAAATAAGAPDVGVLDSSAWASLPADTYVVYSGRFDDKKAAKAALAELKPSFPDAAVVEVSATDDTATDDAPAEAVEVDQETTEALEDLGKATGADYAKQSKKLPDDIGTAGTPPPVDDEAPGGGSDDVTEIQ